MSRRIPGLLFAATVLTTLMAGSLIAGADFTKDPFALLEGIPFAASLLLILGVHEMAHYLTARRHGVSATWPIFIPAPTIIGTFGAVIRIKSAIPDRRALIEIGVSGPLAGFLVALPLSVVGLSLSRIETAPLPAGDGFLLGSSLLFSLLEKMMFGSLPEEANLFLHPVAFAAWIGFFVTALNLLPVGQLDGGHTLYALFGKRQGAVSRAALLLLIPLGFLWWGWFFWSAILIYFMGFTHPPVVKEEVPLDRRRKALGALAAVILILTFTPTPFII